LQHQGHDLVAVWYNVGAQGSANITNNTDRRLAELSLNKIISTPIPSFNSNSDLLDARHSFQAPQKGTD
jgi:hypothetical protein